MKKSGAIVQFALVVGLALGYYFSFIAAAAAIAGVLLLVALYTGVASTAIVIIPLILLWGLFQALPRRDTFVEPGPPLVPAEHPRLFQIIQDVAAETGESVPQQVFVSPDMNLSVQQARSWLGIGGTRVLTVGYPVLMVLNEQEIRAVLAHEFGHFAGDDTRLGGLTAGIANGMYRSIIGVGPGAGAALFARYASLFLRVTASMRRARERSADQIAARVTSPQTIASALCQVDGAASLYRDFVGERLAPVAASGFRPMWNEGFGLYLEASGGQSAIVRNLALASTDSPDSTGFDSHPPLAERLELLGITQTTEQLLRTRHAGDARHLLADIEPQLFTRTFGVNSEAVPLEWSDVSTAMLTWWRRPATFAGWEHLSISSLPANERDWILLASKLRLSTQVQQWRKQMECALADTLCVFFTSIGWTLNVPMVGTVSLLHGELSLDPNSIAVGILSGGSQRAEFERWCEDYGIATMPFGTDPQAAVSGVGISQSAEFTPEGFTSGVNDDRSDAATSPATTSSTDRFELGPWEFKGSKKNGALWCDSETLTVGDSSIKWADIDSIAFRAIRANLQLDHYVVIKSGDKKFSLRLSASKRKNIDMNKRAYATVIQRCVDFAQPVMVERIVEQIEAGETVKVGNVRLSREGWSTTGQFPRKERSWADTQGVQFVGTQYQIMAADKRGASKKAHGVEQNLPNSFLLPLLFQIAAQPALVVEHDMVAV